MLERSLREATFDRRLRRFEVLQYWLSGLMQSGERVDG